MDWLPVHLEIEDAPWSFFSAESKGKKDFARIQCYECKEFGHVVSHCKNTCTYCKQQGHIITECPTQPPKGNGSNQKKGSYKAYHTSVENSDASSSITSVASQNDNPGGISRERIWQLMSLAISSAFSAIGLSRPQGELLTQAHHQMVPASHMDSSSP